ncbi:MAG: DUF4129 domain-containing protein [Halobacteriaceae archaeon]
MTRLLVATTIVAVVAVAVVAASITSPVPGAETPDTIPNRTLPGDGGPPTGDGAVPSDRPAFTLPGIGVIVPVAFDLPPWLGATLVVALLAGILFALVREVRDRPTPTHVDPVTPEEVTTTPTATTGVGDAAGRAADRLLADTDAAITNEVYRTYREMIAHLEVPNPDATSPQEFATAAIEAGLDPGDVETLTSLFERVRYGSDTVTDADRTTVAEILRRIEDRYGSDQAPTEESDTDDTETRTGDIPDPWEDRS